MALTPGDSPLERALGYRFKAPELLEQALTHRSAASTHNERLEFLGDAVFGLVAAELLFRRFPDLREGPLTRARATLVRRESLAELARGIDLGRHLVLGPGELKSGGRQRDSILADALEAVVGAVLLDGGTLASHACVERLLAKRVAEIDSVRPAKDPKTRLQEHLQGRGLELPAYTVAEITGSSHEQRFTVTCRIAGFDTVVVGEGDTRRRAEQAAAMKALELLEET